MIVAVIPLKRLSEAKSRLRGHMSDAERRALAVRLLERTAGALRGSGRIDSIALVSEERELARRLGLVHLPDRGSLNASLFGGVEWSLKSGARALLIVPADLPLVDAADIASLCDAAPAEPGICLSPTRDGGTGALLLTPPDTMPVAFGQGSAERHQRVASERGLAVTLLTLTGLTFDLDTQEDFDATVAQTKEDRLSRPKTTGDLPSIRNGNWI